MSPKKSPTIEELREAYESARERCDIFFEQAEKPLGPEDSAEHQWLKNLTLDALAKFYDAGGKLGPVEPPDEPIGMSVATDDKMI
jgi:hypothetical protein